MFLLNWAFTECEGRAVNPHSSPAGLYIHGLVVKIPFCFGKNHHYYHVLARAQGSNSPCCCHSKHRRKRIKTWLEHFRRRSVLPIVLHAWHFWSASNKREGAIQAGYFTFFLKHWCEECALCLCRVSLCLSSFMHAHKSTSLSQLQFSVISFMMLYIRMP